MKALARVLPALVGLVLLVPVTAAEKSAEEPTESAPKSHPLKGVITGIMTEKSALLVKHEAIPGVMRAMTMMFKVDAATLKAAREGQAITGMMSREGNEWVLRDVKPVAKP